MPRPRNLVLPPIIQVLEAGCDRHNYFEGVSNVITWVDLDQFQPTMSSQKLKRPKTPLSHLMKTIDLRDADPVREGEEHFSYIVCFPEEDLTHDQDDSDTLTIFKERPATSRGSPENQSRGSFSGKNKLLGLAMAARRFMPSRVAEASLFKRVQH